MNRTAKNSDKICAKLLQACFTAKKRTIARRSTRLLCGISVKTNLDPLALMNAEAQRIRRGRRGSSTYFFSQIPQIYMDKNLKISADPSARGSGILMQSVKT